ncbi:MAG: pseudouridine synthase [Deltaproteobacteria bacterium]|nr:pseudouridine synthase [Deltaproteobacteria bacterium]
MRLDRYVSQATGTPRTQTTRWIRGGLVQVGSVVVKDASAQVAIGRDRVRLRGAELDPPGHLVLMLHKPAGVVTSTDTSIGPTVMDCIPADLRRRDLAPIGRLDKDTTGLLLLTTDGGLNHALTHPRRHVEKAYVAVLDGALCADAEARFATGLALGDGTLCQPATLQRLAADQVRIVLREGKFHQVKRMVAACGAAVVALHRERIGDLWLDPTLLPGRARRIDGDELAALGVGRPLEEEAA